MKNNCYYFIRVLNEIKNSEAEIRIHKYGICYIWSIYYVKGESLKTTEPNHFGLETKEGFRKFYSREGCLGEIRKAIINIPREFQEEFLTEQKIFEKVLGM